MKLIQRKRYVEKVLGYLGKGLIIVLTGQRRVGKSCVLQCVAQCLQKGDAEAPNIIYINKEYAEFRHVSTADDLIAYVDAQLRTDRRNYLFIDEVQDITGFEHALRSYQAKEACDIVVTGSNAKMLSGELTTHLSGRYIEVRVQSLGYDEFLTFHQLDNSEHAFRQYLTWGGLPQLAHIGLDQEEMAADYLRDVYNTVIMKDVISRESIRNVRFLTDLVRFLADNTGKNISPASVCRFMRGQGLTLSPAMVSNYLRFLANAYIVARTPLFNLHGRRLLESNEKYYFGDIGLRNALTGVNLRADIEKLLENAVLIRLTTLGYHVTVGQLRQGEIDFVAERKGARKYLQVCYLLANEETIEREFGALSRIPDDYPKYVITMDALATHSQWNGINCLDIRAFLLDDGF